MQYGDSIDSWQNALKSLPPEETMSEAEKNMKEQCEAGLRSARADQMSRQHTRNWKSYPEEVIEGKKLPWDRALAMRERLLSDKEKGAYSSVGIA